MKQIFILILLSLLCYKSNCQNRNSSWCFGDSSGISFMNPNNPVTFTSSVKGRGSCTSISDTIGNLLFYANCGNRNYFPWDNHETEVWTAGHQLMQNTDSVIGEDWYHELCVIPKPNNNHLYYLFTLSILGNMGFNYSIIDMNQNGGNGSVSQKNIHILTSNLDDGMTAIKHGNGRDWWLIIHQWQTNSFYIFYISPVGVSAPIIQNAGAVHNGRLCNFVINEISNKLLVTNYWGLIEVFDFDRCTGLLSLNQTVSPENLSLQHKYFGSSISPSGHYMYVSNTDNIFGDSLRLDQYDLTAPNIAASKINIYTSQVPASGGQHALAPDGKIYMACLYEEGFPYSDTTHNIYTDYLSVINYPDSPGLACNFQPFSFYLGGNRCYWGLPNNPNYDLGRDSGSVCDTIQWTGSSPAPDGGVNRTLNLKFINTEDKLFINAQHLKGTTYILSVTDIMGRQVFSKSGKLQPPYFTFDLDCSAFANGMYVVALITDKEQLTKKFIKE